MGNSDSIKMARLVHGNLPRYATEIMLCAALTSGLWSMLRSSHIKPAATVISPVAADPSSPTADTEVAGMHIFGVSDQSTLTSGQPAQQSSVAILGILSAADEKDSVALLSVDGGSKTLSLGQSLPDGEVVAHIEPAAIVLDRGGESRRVELDIQYADSNAVFRKATTTIDGHSSWSDAYIDGSADSAAIRHARTGILSVPAALPSQNTAVSLATIRAARRSHFDVIRSKPGGAPDGPSDP